MAYSNNARVELTRESRELEERLLRVTAEMNAHPLRVNALTYTINRESSFEMAQFWTELCQYLCDDPYFRPNSPVDCATALFTNKGRIPTKLSKKTGNPSTDKNILTDLTNQGDNLAPAILEARSAITRHGQMRAWAPYAEAGCVQTHWNSTGTPHGRFTSEQPCINNRIDLIRETIESDDGCSFLSYDLSQAEYQAWASLSGDLMLWELFQSGRDFHTEMASTVREAVPTWDLRGEPERQAGKTLNFSLLYLMTPPTLATKLGCSVETAIRITKKYIERAETAVRYVKKVLGQAREQGFVETYFGRRRYCPEYRSLLDERQLHELEKTLWNHHCAGTTAELLKWKQVRTWEVLRRERFTAEQVRLAINEYDQLIWHVMDGLLPEVTAIATEVWNQKEKGFLQEGTHIKVAKTWGGLTDDERQGEADKRRAAWNYCGEPGRDEAGERLGESVLEERPRMVEEEPQALREATKATGGALGTDS